MNPELAEKNGTESYQEYPGGQFKEGNPGRPKGTKHMTTLLTEAIKRVATDTGTSDDKEIIKALVEKAKKGDTTAIEMIFNRSDGKVTDKIEHSGNLNIGSLLDESEDKSEDA